MATHYDDREEDLVRYINELLSEKQELLAALKMAHEELIGCYISTDKFKKIEDAIKKATT